MIAQRLILQRTSVWWAKVLTTKYSEDLAENFAAGLAILPSLLKSPLARPAPLLSGLEVCSPQPFMMATPAYGRTIEEQSQALLQILVIRMPAGAVGFPLSTPRFQRTDQRSQIPWKDNIPPIREHEEGRSSQSSVPSTASFTVEVQPLSLLTSSSASTSPMLVPQPMDVTTTVSALTGQSPHSDEQIHELIIRWKAMVLSMDSTRRGQWQGSAYPSPTSRKKVKKQLLDWLDTVDTKADHTWFQGSFFETPLDERVGELIRQMEDVDFDPDYVDLSLVLETLFLDPERNLKDLATIIELWVWHFGTSLLHFPEVLERYILSPLRRAHPGIHVPSLPWLYFRAHPAIPRDLRFSLRAWYASTFGLPRPSVQVTFPVVAQSHRIYIRTQELRTKIIGATASVGWPTGSLELREKTAWVRLYERLSTSVAPTQPPTPSYSIQETETTISLFGSGHTSICVEERPVFTNLRVRDRFLRDYMDNLGLTMLECLPTREGVAFQQYGDMNAALGREESAFRGPTEFNPFLFPEGNGTQTSRRR